MKSFPQKVSEYLGKEIRVAIFQLRSPISDWAGTKEEDEEELSVWEDNWDDDNVEDDFNQQLRAQLEKQKMDISKK